MITGAHFLLCSTNPDADRRFLRDFIALHGIDVAGWSDRGASTAIRLPSGGEIGLYQTTHPTAVDTSASAAVERGRV